MISYEDLVHEIEKKLSEARFRHSKAVVKRALEYAKWYKVEDLEKVKLVAIAHDIAKEMKEEQIKAWLDHVNIPLDEMEQSNPNLIHAKIGAQICKRQYQFTEEMVNAVSYHTTGRENMSLLEKIIYLADATEETRKYDMGPYVDLIKENMNRGMAEVAKWTIESLCRRNQTIHLDTIKCYNYYLIHQEKD